MSERPHNSLYVEVAIIVPAHNEARNIEGLSQQLRARCPHVLVIDDGSTDRTAMISREAGAYVMRNRRRRGKGAAIRKGMMWAQSRPVRWIAIIDGDNQHSLVDLDRLLDFARKADADLVIGKRDFSEGMPVVRRMTNVLMSRVLSFLAGQAIPDSQCGLRVLSKRAARWLLPVSTGYEVESEMVIRASFLQMKMRFVPIKTVYPAGGKSSIRPLKDTLRWIRFLACKAR